MCDLRFDLVQPIEWQLLKATHIYVIGFGIIYHSLKITGRYHGLEKALRPPGLARYRVCCRIAHQVIGSCSETAGYLVIRQGDHTSQKARR